MDKLHEECGVFGIYGAPPEDASYLIYMGLYALQHRGQESCGICVCDEGKTRFIKDQGQVRDVLDEMLLGQMIGPMGIGHVRYATTGDNSNINAQPLVSRYRHGQLAISHNGNISNQHALREELENAGALFQTTTDSEILLHMISREGALHGSGSLEDAVSRAMPKLRGAYSALLLSSSKLIAFRDPAGMRPLCIGTLDGGYVFASESCALDAVHATFLRDVEPGEIVIIDERGLTSRREHCGAPSHLCVFEYIYVARSDSVIDGQSVYLARREAGRILSRSHPVDADLVFGVPDSGLDAARGYAQESGIPLGRGLVINRYVGRTFILPSQKKREAAVRIKINALGSEVKGQRVIIVDDSIVRGTTCANLVHILRDAGATEVHMRVSSPPFLWPCYFGTDVPSRENLLAVEHSIEEIRQLIGADSLGYLPLEKVHDIAPDATCGFCDACFSGKYPVPLA